jgi:hypothetical protein
MHDQDMVLSTADASLGHKNYAFIIHIFEQHILMDQDRHASSVLSSSSSSMNELYEIAIRAYCATKQVRVCVCVYVCIQSRWIQLTLYHVITMER